MISLRQRAFEPHSCLVGVQMDLIVIKRYSFIDMRKKLEC